MGYPKVTPLDLQLRPGNWVGTSQPGRIIVRFVRLDPVVKYGRHVTYYVDHRAFYYRCTSPQCIWLVIYMSLVDREEGRGCFSSAAALFRGTKTYIGTYTPVWFTPCHDF